MILALLLACPRALPPQAAGEAPCPEGVSVVPFWQGEYPGPVVQIDAPLTLPVSPSACAAPTRECTLEPGLYHPWAQTAAEFYTAQPTARYEAQVDLDLASNRVAAGEIVEIPSYLSEGMCLVTYGESEMEIPCDEVQSGPFTTLPEVDYPLTQYLAVSCGDFVGFIAVDEALFRRKGVREGQILGYGVIGPAEP